MGQSISDILETVFAHLLLDRVVPFELVKIRLQDKASAGKYNGLMDVVMKTVRNEGVLAMYQGLESTMWRHILWNAGYFGCIFQVRQTLPKVDTKKGQMVNDIIAGSTCLPRCLPPVPHPAADTSTQLSEELLVQSSTRHCMLPYQPSSRPRAGR